MRTCTGGHHPVEPCTTSYPGPPGTGSGAGEYLSGSGHGGHMQDPRIRIFVIIVLSVAAFISIAGAALAFLYWICLPGRFRCIKRPAAILFLSMIIVVSVITEFTTGNGLSYFIRMAVILLLALYAYTAYVPGEFFRVSVWLFGTRGFDPGLIAEMSMEALNDLEDDSSKIRIALRQKEVPLGFPPLYR